MTQEKQAVKEQLKTELDKWQAKIDETTVQMHLGVKDTQDKIKPHIKELETELHQAKMKWREFDTNSSGALEELQSGMKSSMGIMEKALTNAKAHFNKDNK